jgi:hypothetical protein
LATTAGDLERRRRVDQALFAVVAEVSAFRDRSLASQSFPYMSVDATYCRARVNRRVVAQAVVVATGVCGLQGVQLSSPTPT